MALTVAASTVAAQSSAELIALGDAAYKERRQKDALDFFVRAIDADANNYEALWKASRSEIDLAEIAPNRPALDALLAAGQRHAEAAVREQPADAEGHFSLARAAGRRALSVGVRDRIRFSKIIRDAALAALKINGTHPGALHVLGMWNAEIMRVNGLSRMFARSVSGRRRLQSGELGRSATPTGIVGATRSEPHRPSARPGRDLCGSRRQETRA